MSGREDGLALRKKELRSLMKEKLSHVSNSAREVKSRHLCERIISSSVWRKAEIVLAFMPLPGEPDLRFLFEQALDEGRIVGLPRMEGRSLVFHRIGRNDRIFIRHPYGVLEPGRDLPEIEKKEMARKICLVLCPGLAFDSSGIRLGRGKGFYDGFLSSMRREKDGGLHSAGVCFSFQILDSIPRGIRDVPVESIFTDEETITV